MTAIEGKGNRTQVQIAKINGVNVMPRGLRLVQTTGPNDGSDANARKKQANHLPISTAFRSSLGPSVLC